MFTTYKHTKVPFQIVSAGEELWPYVELSINCPWFCCEYERLLEDQSFSSTIFFTNIEHIKTFKKLENVNVIAVYLVSPSYLNETGDWKMNKLAKIQSAELKYKDSSVPIIKYVSVDGSSLIYNVTGIDRENKKQLVFTDEVIF
jgi:hypothetical protein